MGTAGLNYISEFLGLGQQGIVQDLEARDEVIYCSLRCRNVGCSGEGVVGGLTHVHVVIRVNLHAVLVGDGGDDLVGVHVGGGAGAGLEDVNRESIVVLALCNLGGGGDDGVSLLRVQLAGVLVHLSTGSLQEAESANLRIFETTAGDWEVLHGALGLGTPQGVCRNLYLAHGVVFNAVFSHGFTFSVK